MVLREYLLTPVDQTREERFAVGKQTPLTDMELRILVAVEETRGDHWKIADALKDSGLLKNQRAGVRKALEPLEKRGFVEQVADESYRLTGAGRHAARAAIERFPAWLDHAMTIL